MTLSKLFFRAVGLYFVAFLTLSQVGPASADVAAEDKFSLGRQAYMARNYNGARDCLLAFTKTNPESYQAHYLLGNCYLQLGETEQAKLSYALALANKPDKITEERCQTVLAQIAHMKTSTAKPKQSVEPRLTGDKEDDEKKGKTVDDLRIRALEADILAIEKSAREEVARIQVECKEAVAAASETYGRWWRNYETGERRFGINDTMEQSVRAPFEARIEQVRKTASERVEGKHKEIEALQKELSTAR